MKPTIEILIGAPLSGHEGRLLRCLYADLEPTGALILANFQAGQRQLDFVVVTESYAAILEHKQFSRPIYGGRNGQWAVEDSTGTRKPYSGPNPWQQTLQQKFALSDEMKRHEKRTGSGAGSRGLYTEFDAFVCVVPAIHPRSDVTSGDDKVAVRSYADVIDTLRSAAKPASWSRADWSRFGTEHLGLMAVALDEATDSKVRTARETVRGYQSRIESVVGFQLPPLLWGTDDVSVGQPLVQSILGNGQHHFLVGPSGSAKTFHLHHIAIAAVRQGDEVPFLVEARTYRGGDFWQLIRRGVAPLFSGEPKELFDAGRLCGVSPILLVDALNECPSEYHSELLRRVLAFVLRFGARVVFTGQQAIELPADLKATVRQLRPPSPTHRRSIYCHHAGMDVSPAIDFLCEGFTNAYDLTVAGRCHAAGAPAKSRVELYDRYVRLSIPEHYHVAIALLRAVAATMEAGISTTWERADYEVFAERFLRENGAPLTILDKLSSSRLIRLTEDFFAFEHELLGDYFCAAEVLARLKGSVHLATRLQKPLNQRLIELILPRLSDDDELANVLTAVTDPRIVDSVLLGQCGERARAALLAQIRCLFALAAEDLANVKCKCYIAELDGRRRLSGIGIEGTRAWNSYFERLCQVIAHHLDEPSVADGFLELLDVTEYTLRRCADEAAAEQRIEPHRVWEETVRLYSGIFTPSTMELPCTTILLELRTALIAKRYPNGLPISQALFDRATATPGSDLALRTLLQDRDSGHYDAEAMFTLVQLAWTSQLSILSMDGLEFVRWRRMRRALPAEAETRIAEMLGDPGTEPPPVSLEDALREMRATIASDAVTQPEVIAAARTLETEPAILLANRADRCLSNIFGDIFQGAYGEAYFELSRKEKCAILSRAAECPQSGLIDWLLHELLQHGSRDALGVYERFAYGVDGATCCPQDATGAFLLAIKGCARWSETPPPFRACDGAADRAWATMGEILFWTYRQSHIARTLWSRFEGQTRLAAADVLYNVAHVWILDTDERPALTLLELYADELRPIVEDCLHARDCLPSLFNYGGSRSRSVVLHLIDLLSKIGDERSVSILRQLVDDMELGGEAIRAIRSIRRAPVQSAP